MFSQNQIVPFLSCRPGGGISCFSQLQDLSLIVAAKVSATASRFTVSPEKMAAAATEVSSQIFTVASSSEEMTATAMEIANNCAGAANSSRTAADSAVAGASIVQENVVVMNRIADQTNLLALNAAIEAERRGTGAWFCRCCR
jgi:methyl-accepting chemotaxis protein